MTHAAKKIHAGRYEYRGFDVDYNDEATPGLRWWVKLIGAGLHCWPETAATKREAMEMIDKWLDE